MPWSVFWMLSLKPTFSLSSFTFIKKLFSFSLLSAIAAAAKSLQSCLTVCDPIDGSPPGSPVPGILQARTLEWVAISSSSAWKWKVKVNPLSRVLLFTTHGLQPTRLLHPWDFPGKSTGVGCHRLLLSAIRVVVSVYLRLLMLIFLLSILIPACASSSPAFCMMYSAYMLNKQGDNIQP